MSNQLLTLHCIPRWKKRPGNIIYYSDFIDFLSLNLFKEVDVSGASNKHGEDDQATRSEFERLLQQEKQTVHPNSTNSINTVSTPVSTAGPSFTNDAPSSLVNAARTSEEHLFEQFSPFKNAFTLPDVPNVFSNDDTGIFGNTYDDADVGAEADLKNLETTMNVSLIPITRIDKDHPKDQIIRDLTSAIQTRRMTKISDEHAMKVIQALEDPSWIEEMQEELLQFQLQKVWTLVNLPNGKWAIRTKWVFRNKKYERGIVIRNKANMVTQGYTQEEGIDYDEVFALVARIEAIRGGICLPTSWLDKVYKVEKALYGLHQAPKAWYETLSTYLIKNGFRRGTIDKTLFIKKDKGDILLVQVYVDDIIFGSTKKSLCDEFEGLMHKRFQMSSMGEFTFFLGLQVQQKEDGIFISQDKYVAEILKKFDFATVKTASTLMEHNKALVKDEEADSVDVHLYRSMIGSLMGGLVSAAHMCLKMVFQFEEFSDSNDDSTSIDDDYFSIDDINYVDASPPESELVSLEVIKALKDNPTPSFDFVTKSPSTSPNSFLEETDTSYNSLSEFKTFCFNLEEKSSGNPTSHSNLSLPDYEAFFCDSEPNSGDFTMDVVEGIRF
ncbi:putative ribonuclease H-like domain-containing protein [Tanacetum coccineum]